MPPRSRSPQGDNNSGFWAMHFFSPNFPDNSKGRVNPTIVDAPIKTKAINPRCFSTPMKRIKLWIKVVPCLKKIGRKNADVNDCQACLSIFGRFQTSSGISHFRYLISYGIFLSGNPFNDYSYFKFKAKPKELSSQNVQREFRTSVIDDTQEVRRVGLEDDEFVFALSNTETWEKICKWDGSP